MLAGDGGNGVTAAGGVELSGGGALSERNFYRGRRRGFAYGLELRVLRLRGLRGGLS